MKVMFTCQCCGKVIEYDPLSDSEEDIINHNLCWYIVFHISEHNKFLDIYGSELDGVDKETLPKKVCDKCLASWLSSFKLADMK